MAVIKYFQKYQQRALKTIKNIHHNITSVVSATLCI